MRGNAGRGRLGIEPIQTLPAVRLDNQVGVCWPPAGLSAWLGVASRPDRRALSLRAGRVNYAKAECHQRAVLRLIATGL